ncbi:WYL domain-containing protein [Terasakiella sp. A23]|uniref:helix-turn-helix transcriptional regulator n=1 Tax=Terasakiella sp. FCG-A23 TaxID=3080561 RepID=UPI0029532243|nr:WYL domain-containing protein [Terasakiella sp. A23]MDV7341822.1 WYL domain-containing protein [Terasakiella sp. A23]
MPSKKSEALPGDKLLIVYQLLTGDGRRHFQADIAEKLECSPQTVSRLIDKIEPHLGKDAYVEKGLDGKKRFYQLKTSSEKRSLGFSFEELHFLSTFRDIASSSLPEKALKRMDDTLTFLALTLGERSAQDIPIGFRSKGYIEYTPHFETIASLRKAIRTRQACKVIYKANGRKKASEYRYAAGRILVMNGSMYVLGYTLGAGSLVRERPTTFSIHRISEIELTGERFTFNAAEGDACHFGLDWHPPKRMHVHIAPQAADYVQDRIWSEDQEIDEHDDGSLTLAVTTTSERELNAWVMSFGDLAHIVKSQR